MLTLTGYVFTMQVYCELVNLERSLTFITGDTSVTRRTVTLSSGLIAYPIHTRWPTHSCSMMRHVNIIMHKTRMYIGYIHKDTYTPTTATRVSFLQNEEGYRDGRNKQLHIPSLNISSRLFTELEPWETKGRGVYAAACFLHIS